MLRLPPSQGEESDPVVVKIDFSPHEPVTPVPSDREHPSEKLGSAGGVDSTQEDDVPP